MKKLVIIAAITFAVVWISVGIATETFAQTRPTLDDGNHIVRRELIRGNETTVTEIGRSTLDGDIWIVITDSTGEIDNRPATPAEVSFYLRRERLQNVERWVNNRVAEMIQCETEGANGLLLGNWGGMTGGQQNAVIHSLMDCQEQASVILKTVLPEMLDILKELDTAGLE